LRYFTPHHRITADLYISQPPDKTRALWG